MHRFRYSFLAIILFFLCRCNLSDQHPYKDLQHFSHTFNKNKYYRIYLPRDYYETDKEYPVIYFLYGWGGRHFKDDNARLDYDRIGELVDIGQVILVMMDGNIEEPEPSPAIRMLPVMRKEEFYS